MTLASDRRRLAMLLCLALVCAAAIAGEAYVVFADRVDIFRIEGKQPYEIAEFAAGQRVAQAFWMRGDGLQSVSVRFHSDRVALVKLHWMLWRGEPGALAGAFHGVEFLDLQRGYQWKTLMFPRDGSSSDHWYTLQLRLLDAAPSPNSAHVTVGASRDNPDRGGVLWVNEVRQTGSLFLRAERGGRTPYRRFLADAAPNLPAALRIPAVQWTIVVALHWAFIVLAYAVLADSSRNSASARRSP